MVAERRNVINAGSSCQFQLRDRGVAFALDVLSCSCLSKSGSSNGYYKGRVPRESLASDVSRPSPLLQSTMVMKHFFPMQEPILQYDHLPGRAR